MQSDAVTIMCFLNQRYSRRQLGETIAVLAIGVLALHPPSARAQPSATNAAPPPAPLSGEVSPAAILATMERVADWQLAHPPTHGRVNERDWTYGAFYAGIMALSDIADTPKYHDALVAMGRKYNWEPGPRRYHADDQCVCQTYLDLFLQDRDPAMAAPTRTNFDYILANPATNGLKMGTPGNADRWSWCDALFMAPPAWARLSRATDDPRYLEFMDHEWQATSDYLYDKDEHLFFRDSTYFDKREANGKKVFWSRGNGWVMAGLARVLKVMPADFPNRPRYERQFMDMAQKVASLQQPDGLWRPSLLDPEAYPMRETSGSGFYTFALAWGLNHGLLDIGQYSPVVSRAWPALVACATPEGRLEHVQPVGGDPQKFDPTHNDVFGTGAFLLAGSEVYRMAKLGFK